MAQTADVHGVAGDEILISGPGHSSGRPDRRGTIRAVLGEAGREHYRVCWPEGRESVLPAGIGRLATYSRARRDGSGTTVWVLGSASNETNVELVRQWRRRGLDTGLLSPLEARATLRRGDVALGRLDVLRTLDGVEAGLLALLWLERRGAHVLNPAAALVAVHDKLVTARRLVRAGLPHPRTAVVRGDRDTPLTPPLVLKPRFGSWGRDVLRCRDRAELERTLEAVRERPWFRRHGALVQELVPSRGYDLRLIVAAGEVIGASERVARPGEWRTNVSLGGSLRPVVPPPEARSLAIAAAAAVGADLAGVDLMPVDRGRFIVLELNGAVDFDERYSFGGRDVFLEAARALGLSLERAA